MSVPFYHVLLFKVLSLPHISINIVFLLYEYVLVRTFNVDVWRRLVVCWAGVSPLAYKNELFILKERCIS